jgi:WD40 repeat protein
VGRHHRHHLPVLATLSHRAGVYGVAFRSDGKILATTSLDRTAKLWDVSDLSHPRELTTLIRHAGFVLSAAFSRDGRVLATASSDMTVRLWDITDLQHSRELPVLAGHTAPVYGLAFSPDGHTLATASHGKTVRLWEIDPDRIAARICALARPAITRTEWDHYFPGVTYRLPCPVPGPPRR